MDNSSLPYLSRIAASLEKLTGGSAVKSQNDVLATIAKSIGVSATIETAGNANAAEIADNLNKGLLTTVQEEQEGEPVDVVKSLLELMRTALVETMEKAFTITVQEEQGGETVEVKKSIFEVMKNEMVLQLRDALTVEVSVDNTTVRKGVAQLLNEQNAKIVTIDTTLGNIKTDLDGIKGSLDGTTAGGVAAKLDAINNSLSGVSSNLSNIQTNTANTASRLLDSHSTSVADRLAGIGTDTDLIRSHTNQIEGETELIRQYVDGVEGKLDSLIYNTRNVDGIGNDTDVIRQKVTSIDNKVQ